MSCHKDKLHYNYFCPVFLYLLSFFRKGKTKPLDLVIKDDSGNYLNLFTSIGDGRIGNADIDLASAFVCHMYNQPKENYVNAARYNKLMQMTGKVSKA